MRFTNRFSGSSVLAQGALRRVGIAVVALGVLWLAVLWSVVLP